MHKYADRTNESWGRLRSWFETNFGEQPFTEVLKTSEQGFVHKYSTACRNGAGSADGIEPSAEELRRFHRAVSSAAHKTSHLLFSLYNLSVGDKPAKTGVPADLPDFFGDAVSYSDIFECLAGADGSLDVFSPAAYFADLMRIIETYITSEFAVPDGHRLRDRRPDLYTRMLTRENTETLLPYTDIILERLVATLQKLDPDTFGSTGAAYDAGTNEAYRPNTDKTYRSGPIEAYCAAHVYPVGLPYSRPFHIVAASLKKGRFNFARLLAMFMPDLPPEHYTAAAWEISVDHLAALGVCGQEFYPELDALTDWSEVDAGMVMRAAGLTLEELDTLFGRGIKTAEEFERTAPGFYINRGLSSCLELSADAKSVTGLTKAALPGLIRFVRIAALTGAAYDQLDAVIADRDMDSALSVFAAIQNMSKSADQLLPLISSLYDHGQAGTFQAVYGGSLSLNETCAFSEALPAVAAALGCSEQDISTLYTYLFASSGVVAAVQLNALYRNTCMAELLGIGIEEYITLTELAGIGCGSLQSVFSAETITALLAYADLCAMNAYEARYICTGMETSYAGSGIKKEDFTAFTDDLKRQAAALSEEKRCYAAEQGLIRFLGIDPAAAPVLFRIIPSPPDAFGSWQETFYTDQGLDFAFRAVLRLARGKLLMSRLPADVFALFAGELFTDDLARDIPYQDLVTLCRVCAYYRANPVFFMLAADAFSGEDSRAALAALCGLSESDIDTLANPVTLTASCMLQFAARLDAVKTVGISVSNLMACLTALTKENGCSDLSACAAGLPVPEGVGREYCRAVTALTVQRLNAVYRDISTPEALSAYLLLDVQTNDAVQTSYIHEGINAALTYLNRCRSGLEPGVGKIREISENYWSWIMDFSVWKANRMIFVEPENYLLPDIRSSQSSLFKNALQSVSGKPLDLAAAESFYGKYLDDYAELSNIIPCASCLSSETDSEQLYLFGRTAASGGKLHYCVRKDGIWGEWTEVLAPVPAAEITPIFIFGKLYIFWIERSSESAPRISYTPAVSSDDDTPAQLLQTTSNVTKLSVKYTYCNLLGTWNTIQTLFEETCAAEDSEVDYGRQFKNTYDVGSEGYARLSAFRITERNFCDSSGHFYISQSSEFEKLLIMFGGFVYRFPHEIIENYYPLSNPFESRDKAAFSDKHAGLCDKINILSRQNVSGRLCSGSVHIYGSTLREEHAVADGEFLIFDEYTGGPKAAAPAVATDESASIISAVLTADVLKDTLCSSDRITPKFVGQALPEYGYTGESGDYRGEFCDTLNTYVLGTEPAPVLRDFQNYLEGTGIAVFRKNHTDEAENQIPHGRLTGQQISGAAGCGETDPRGGLTGQQISGAAGCGGTDPRGRRQTDMQASPGTLHPGNDSGGTVQISPSGLSANTFYTSAAKTGVSPLQFCDLYSILLQCLGSQNLFGSTGSRLASNSEIIKTVNLAGGFLLKTGGNGGETFLLTPVPEQDEKGKPARLKPTDGSIVISYPKITVEDIEQAIGDCDKNTADIFDALCRNDPPVIDIDGYVYTPNASGHNIAQALEILFGKEVPEQVTGGLVSLLNNRRLASSLMFWSQNLNRADSVAVFNAFTDHSGNDYTVLPVDTAVSMNINPKVTLKDTRVIGSHTSAEVSAVFSQYINAPLPVSLRFCGDGGYGFDVRAIKYDVTRLTNASLAHILPSFSAGGVDAFLKLENQQAPVPACYPIERFAPNTEALNLPSALDGAQPDFDGLYKNYNYELFYHLPMYAAKTLRNFGNYSEAKKWLEYIYSPLASETFIDAGTFTPFISGRETDCISVLAQSGLLIAVSGSEPVKYRVRYGFCPADLASEEVQAKLKAAGLLPEDINNTAAILSNHALCGPYGYCWKFFPFRTRTVGDLMDDLNDSAELRTYHNHPLDPHAIASLRIGAYEKYTVLEYVDLLIEWGDREFAKLTWDSIAHASVLYSLAGEVLGKRPAAVIRRNVQNSEKCFDDLYNRTAGADRLTELRNRMTAVLLDEQDQSPGEFICDTANTEFFFPYFKIPANTAMLAKWDLVDDRLAKIRHNLDINGNPRTIPLFPASADPLQLARTRAAGYAPASADSPAAGTNWYRYSVLYACAKEFTAALIQFSAQLLSSIEKGDEEALRVLSARQSAKLTALTKRIRKNTIEQLEQEREALELAKTAAENRQIYYENLVSQNISKTEAAAIAQNIAAGAANLVSAGLSAAGGAASLVPEAGSPFAMVYGGREISNSLMNFSMASMSTAASLGISAGVTDAYAAYERRLAEWKFQAEQAKNDIGQLKKQISVNRMQREAAALEQKHTELLDVQTAELMDFYQTKFSSCSLYGAFSGLLRRMVFHSYQTAIELSARAEAAWQEETDDSTGFLTYTYWDDAKCGLLSGEALMNGLDAMQAAYIAKNPRRLEITKTISLANALPDAFAQLQSGNICSFTLPLSLFDDEKQPANRLHKIRSLTISTQVVIGAYQNISATLTQTGSVILADPKNPEATAYTAQFGQSGAAAYTAQFGQRGAAAPSGVIVNRRAGQTIHISNAQNETGMHFYDPAGSAYLPFEGTGAVSQWSLAYGEKNPFSPGDISDIILSIAYTALPSGKV